MRLRSWILAAMCAALTIGMFTPEQAQAGWRRRVYGPRWHGGYAWRRGWGGGGYAWRGRWRGSYGGFGGYGYGGGGYGVCSTGFGFGGNYMAGAGLSYGTPYGGAYSMPYYANTYVANPYLGNAYLGNPYNGIGVASAPSLYAANMSAGQWVTAPSVPGDPVAISSPTTSFLARYTAVVRNTSPNTDSDRAKNGTSFVARHSPGRGNAIEPSAGLKSSVKPGNGYGYGLASSSGYGYKSGVANAPKEFSNYGLPSVAMNR